MFGFGYVNANQSRFNATLSFQNEKETLDQISEIDYPALYNSNSDYSTLFAVSKNGGTKSNFYEAKEGATFTVTAKGVFGKGTVKLFLKNKTWHIANHFSGVFFY